MIISTPLVYIYMYIISVYCVYTVCSRAKSRIRTTCGNRGNSSRTPARVITLGVKKNRQYRQSSRARRLYGRNTVFFFFSPLSLCRHSTTPAVTRCRHDQRSRGIHGVLRARYKRCVYISRRADGFFFLQSLTRTHDEKTGNSNGI